MSMDSPAAGVPDEVGFATEVQMAREMLEQALDLSSV